MQPCSGQLGHSGSCLKVIEMESGQLKPKGTGRKSLRFSDLRGVMRTSLRDRKAHRVRVGQAEGNVVLR